MGGRYVPPCLAVRLDADDVQVAECSDVHNHPGDHYDSHTGAVWSGYVLPLPADHPRPRKRVPLGAPL